MSLLCYRALGLPIDKTFEGWKAGENISFNFLPLFPSSSLSWWMHKLLVVLANEWPNLKIKKQVNFLTSESRKIITSCDEQYIFHG